jgi:hypothetical protein
MTRRRVFISTIATVGATAIAGCSSGGSSIVGPPATENKIGEVQGPTETTYDYDNASAGDDAEDFTEEELSLPIQRIEFYESGAANVIPTNEQGPYDQFAIVHSATDLNYSGASIDTDDALGVWEFGDFDEPVTVDLAGAIAERSNYPSRTFKLRVLPEDGAVIDSTQTMTFEVPEPFMPE